MAASFVGLLVVAPAAALAQARPAKVAIVAIEMKGNVAPELRGQVQRSILAGITEANQRPLLPKKLRTALRKTPDLQNCTSTACLQRIGELTGATRFVNATVDGSGAAYTVTLELLGPDPANRVIAHKEIKCAVCTITDLSSKISATTATLFSEVPSRPSEVVIVTRPQGADLRINDKDTGAAPYRGKLAPGKHRVTALLGGHKETELTIEVKPATETPQRFEVILARLEKVVRPQPPPPEVKRPYKILKYVAAGAGGIALLTGLALLGMNNEGTCNPEPPITQCRELHNTTASGWLTIGAAAGLGAAAVWMWLRDGKARVKEQERNTAILAPTPGGAVIGWQGRF